MIQGPLAQSLHPAGCKCTHDHKPQRSAASRKSGQAVSVCDAKCAVNQPLYWRKVA